MASASFNGTSFQFSSKEEVLQLVATGKVKIEQAAQMLAVLEPTRAPGKLSCKVSEKGAISVYGLQRMPVTLYVEQWERLLEFGDQIKTFAKANDSKLTRKPKA